MKRLCTICARGGSKGVAGKNIRKMGGIPLIAHSIKQAQKSNVFDVIAVSSDSDDILEVARDFGVSYLIKRPLKLASDKAGKIPAIRHCVLEVEKLSGQRFDTLVDLDATSPLRNIEDILNVLNMLEEGFYQNIITVTPSKKSPYFNVVEKIEGDRITLSKALEKKIIRRQDAPITYDMNASIYAWIRKSLFNENHSVINEATGIYTMPAERSVDIDSEIDFLFVEFLMRSA